MGSRFGTTFTANALETFFLYLYKKTVLHSLVHQQRLHNVRNLLAGPPLDACSQERECPHLGDIKGMLLAAASSLVALAGRAQCMCAGKGWVKLEGGGQLAWVVEAVGVGGMEARARQLER